MSELTVQTLSDYLKSRSTSKKTLTVIDFIKLVETKFNIFIKPKEETNSHVVNVINKLKDNEIAKGRIDQLIEVVNLRSFSPATKTVQNERLIEAKEQENGEVNIYVEPVPAAAVPAAAAETAEASKGKATEAETAEASEGKATEAKGDGGVDEVKGDDSDDSPPPPPPKKQAAKAPPKTQASNRPIRGVVVLAQTAKATKEAEAANAKAAKAAEKAAAEQREKERKLNLKAQLEGVRQSAQEAAAQAGEDVTAAGVKAIQDYISSNSTDYQTDENLADVLLAMGIYTVQLPAVVKQEKQMQAATASAMTQSSVPPAEGEEGGKSGVSKEATQGVDRQNELSANEVEALVYHKDYSEQLDAVPAQLIKEKDRGNLGAGTAATGPIADLWGYLPSQPTPDKVVPELLFDTKQDGTLIEGDTEAPEGDKFTFLPFAKLGGSIVWVPRNAKAAKFFFTSQDYDELVSHVQDGDTLSLANEDMVDVAYMLDSIVKLFMSLHLFCDLAPMLSATQSNRTQIYAEWLELRQLSRALVAYQQNTAGMYENASISMRGGIRAAVGAALKPLYEKLKIQEEQGVPPASGSTLGNKRQRAGEMGIVRDEDYNPQFSFEPIQFKRTKFSIPII